eukprot:TRINITY_DN25994_c0_g1_i1.p1 TRINITY_DN25994_c0_g1~~TRINITY_DN25994_c0_g1_i1.p1  ORF type:complete len:302 (+),score=67.24 TRINITY_DN25994_c0_g1_i1:73-978(+)
MRHLVLTKGNQCRYLASREHSKKWSEVFCSFNGSSKLSFFFPGDIQSFEWEMQEKEWTAYSYEATINILSEKFQSNVVIIRPPMAGSFANYEDYLNPGHLIEDLVDITKSVQHKAKSLGYPFTAEKIILSAFSRGVLVLNHIISEYTSFANMDQLDYFVDWQGDKEGSPLIKYPSWEHNLDIYRSHTPTAPFYSKRANLLGFISKVSEIHYLDGHRFPTNAEVCKGLSDLTSKGLQLFIHASPRQIESESQTWVPIEYSLFLQHLNSNHSHFNNIIYFKDLPKSLQNHFLVLKSFHTTPQE